MKYQVHDAGDGRFEIQRIEPVTIGVMYDEAMADLVLAILETDDTAIFEAKAKIDKVKVDHLPPAEVAEALPEKADNGLHKIGGTFIERPAQPFGTVEDANEAAPSENEGAAQAAPDTTPKAPPQPAPAPVSAPGKKLVTPMMEAFERIDAGEKLGVVADELGLKMPMVRAAYARRARALKEEAESAAPDHREREECRLCGREFTASAESDGLCGRCARGM